MRKKIILFALCALCGCASYDGDELPPYYEQAVDTDLLIFKTDDIRVCDVEKYLIAYEYNDKNVTLAQLGKMAKRFCYAKGRDTVLTDNTVSNRDNFRRAVFECQEHPVLLP